MLNDDGTCTDEVGIDAEGLNVGVEYIFGGRAGGPQSKPTLWIPTSHPSCSECGGS